MLRSGAALALRAGKEDGEHDQRADKEHADRHADTDADLSAHAEAAGRRGVGRRGGGQAAGATAGGRGVGGGGDGGNNTLCAGGRGGRDGEGRRGRWGGAAGPWRAGDELLAALGREEGDAAGPGFGTSRDGDLAVRVDGLLLRLFNGEVLRADELAVVGVVGEQEEGLDLLAGVVDQVVVRLEDVGEVGICVEAGWMGCQLLGRLGRSPPKTLTIVEWGDGEVAVRRRGLDVKVYRLVRGRPSDVDHVTSRDCEV